MYKQLDNAKFLYHSYKTGELEDREVLILDVAEDSVLGILLNNVENKEEVLKAAKLVSDTIAANSNKFRRFKLGKIVESVEKTE